MSFPIAHGLLGATILLLANPQRSDKFNWKIAAIGAFLGILPDFDYLLNWIRIFGSGWHHGFSHSFVFALIIGIITAWLVKDFSFRMILAFSLAVASHAMLDFFITESRGVALFSPFTDYRFKMELPNPIEYEWASESLSGKAVNILRICAVELMIFLPLFLLSIWAKKIYKIGKT
jgi:membrane-bound metal-dependent hydrolase YbcI (DUF457 family)